VGIPKTIALRSMRRAAWMTRRPFRYLNPSVTEESSSFLPPPSVATSGTRRMSAAPIRNITTSIPYVKGSPAVEISSPATAGRAAAAAVVRVWFSASEAGRRARPTRPGTIA
jgi:hypothetical protein